jgi:rRNA maturation RNase YbeY
VNDHHHSSSRLFGSNPESPNAKPGLIALSDDRDLNESAIIIDLAALHKTIETTREIIGYPTYDVSLSLVDDSYMQELNMGTRGVNAPTDVLSFCFQDNFVKPGVLGEVQFDIGDYYNLGDMIVDVDYVKRKCESDRAAHDAAGDDGRKQKGSGDGMMEGEVVSERVVVDSSVGGGGGNVHSSNEDEEDDDDDFEYEYMEVEVDEYDDRGVAPAMQYVYDPEIRIHMLIVHGMLHLVGYDHIEDDDYELMVVREDEVLAELKQRLGDDFGLSRGKALPER